jgi:hypothetical protein
MPTATWPMPDHESSQIPSAWSARSYEGIEHPAKPSAATRSRPRWSSTRYSINLTLTLTGHAASECEPAGRSSVMLDTGNERSRS